MLNKSSPSFCILPFIHINSSVTGKMRPCCNTQKYFSFTDKELSFSEGFRSEEMEELRYQLNNGMKPDICSVCWKNESNGIRSQRESNNRKFSEYNEMGLQFLDVKFDNKCNLQCRMCDPYSSNQIWKTMMEVDEVPNHLKHINLTEEEYNKRDNSQLRKQYVLESLPNLTFLKCTGGEPFVSEHFLEVLHKAVETGHSKHIKLSITTNGTKFTRKITDLFEHFKAIDINISVDGCDESYDYVRYPFKWDKWYNRIIDFLTDMEEIDHPDFKYRFSTVVTVYNYLNLCDLQQQIDGIVGMFPTLNPGYDKVNSFDFDLKPSNSELHAKWLPNHILKHERDKARELFNIKYSTNPLNGLEGFVDQWKFNATEEKRKELVKSSITIDKVRRQTYKSLHPMLVEWMNG